MSRVSRTDASILPWCHWRPATVHMIANHATCNTYERMSAVRAFLNSQMSVSLLIGLTLELSGGEAVRLNDWLGLLDHRYVADPHLRIVKLSRCTTGRR